ncbi:MAG TPA: sulfotransferase [Alphaproteobacteria bacterium]|nr:sulfotransferase [Alphaproteobacteria bacterium]
MSPAHDNPLFPIPFGLLMGPQRAGTTWVDRYLRSRGDVCLPEEVKEVFFFDRNFQRGSDFYKSHFKLSDQDKLAIEITATSFDHPEAAKRVEEVFGRDVKLVCPLRHPITRSYSLYLHYLRYGLVKGTLQDAIEQVPQILDSSRYTEHLSKWFDIFGQDNITLIYQEELESDQLSFVKKLCDGLGLDFVEPSEEVQGRYNITTFSKFGFLAFLSQQVADFLRYYRLYFIINFAKSIGVKKLIFGKERPDAKKDNIPEEDLIFLKEKIGVEADKFEKFIGQKVLFWQGIYED